MADRQLPTIDVRIPVRGGRLPGDLAIPFDPAGVVVVVDGSGRYRFSPRGRDVARVLRAHGMATLLVDLLTPAEEQRDRSSAHHRFDVALLTRRVESVIDWATQDERLRRLPVGLYGAELGAAVALSAAAHEPELVAAVVSRSGKAELAGPLLPQVQAPTLLMVGGNDPESIDRSQRLAHSMHCTHRTSIVRGAGRQFREPGALERSSEMAAAWFVHHLAIAHVHGVVSPDADDTSSADDVRHIGPFADRAHAGETLARWIVRDAPDLVDPIVLAIPRGGVEVAIPVARALDAPLDVVVSRSIAVPLHPEISLGAVDELGGTVFVERMAHALQLQGRERHDMSRSTFDGARRDVVELRGGRPLPMVAGREVVLVDDGHASGIAAVAAARLLRRHGARRVVLATPVAPRNLVVDPPPEFDQVVCPYAPEPFRSVGVHYDRFDRLTDADVRRMLGESTVLRRNPAAPGPRWANRWPT